MNNRLNILYQCSNEYAFMGGVSFASLVHNCCNTIEYYVYLLTPSISDKDKINWLSIADRKDNVHLVILDGSDCEKEANSWNVPEHRGSRVTYYKLLLDRYFKDIPEVEKIIHIGADTLVTGDLHELLDFDFEGKPFAMNWNEYMRFPRYPKEAQYCIAEMIYFNLPEWRSHNCEERILEHIKKYGDIFGSKDQGILCTRFIGEYKQLPLKFNIYGMSYYFTQRNRYRMNNAPILTKKEIDKAYDDVQIIHLARTFLYRPCEQGSLDRLSKMWWDYCKSSPWESMDPITPNPPLILPEKLFRRIFMIFPMPFAEWLYIKARHWSADVQWFVWKIAGSKM